MRHHVHTVFDDYVPVGASPVFTSAEFDHKLGAADEFAIQVVIDNTTGSSTFSLWIQMSGDGRNWTQRTDTVANGYSTGDAEIYVADVSAAAPTVRIFSDACKGNMAKQGTTAIAAPLLPFVRFRMAFGSSTGGHVKVHVVHRGPR